MKLRIGHVAKLFDVKEETLRYYEKEGFLSPEKIRPTDTVNTAFRIFFC